MKDISKYSIAVAAAIMMLSGGCRDKKQDPSENFARDLYSKSLRLTRIYTDSIAAAKDSVTLLGIDSRFDKAMTELNYGYTPDVALKITEGENDTLVNLTDRYVALRDSLLYRFAHPVVVPDSLSPDSI